LRAHAHGAPGRGKRAGPQRRELRRAHVHAGPRRATPAATLSGRTVRHCSPPRRLCYRRTPLHDERTRPEHHYSDPCRSPAASPTLTYPAPPRRPSTPIKEGAGTAPPHTKSSQPPPASSQAAAAPPPRTAPPSAARSRRAASAQHPS
jgi:hypothetical protein